MAPEEARLARIEGGMTRMGEDIAAIKALLGERCSTRGEVLDDLDRRVCVLEDDMSRRKGGMAVLGAVCAASSVLGGLVVKLWPFVGKG